MEKTEKIRKPRKKNVSTEELTNQVVKEVVIPNFPKLYQLNNNQKIYEWSIRIELSSNDSYDVITEHGEKDGNMVRHMKNIDKGKASRTVLEQAILDAESKWKNKKEKDLYNESVEVTTNNTENRTIVRPMLANTFSFDVYKTNGRGFKISFPAYVQRKYDGIRCISYLKDGEVILESRKGIPFQNFNGLREQLKSVLSTLPDTMYLDGELYTDEIDFETLSGLVRVTTKKASREDLEKIERIQYHIYDYVDTNDLSLIYERRKDQLEDLIRRNQHLSLLRGVVTETVNNLEDVKRKHDEYVQEGYEGLMVRDKNGPYEVQKRSKYLQKYKEFMEEEFKIVGFHDGTGDERGCVLWDCETRSGSVFSVRPRGTKESRMKLYTEGNKYINKLLTVIFQEYSADGIPRFPVGKGIRDIF